MDIDATAGQTRLMPFDLEAFKGGLTKRFPMVSNHPDIAGLFRDPELLVQTATALAEPFRELNVSTIVAPEARGPVLGALVARELKAGLVLLRKEDRNHPGADIPIRSEPTWRGSRETFQGRSFDIRPGDRLIVVDDWVTTGSTIRSAISLSRVLGGDYLGSSVVVNKTEAHVIEELAIRWLVRFEDLGATSEEPAASARLPH